MDTGGVHESIQRPVGVVAALSAGARRFLSFGAGNPVLLPYVAWEARASRLPFLKVKIPSGARAHPETIRRGQLTRKEEPMLYRVVLAFVILTSAATLRAPAETIEERLACTPDAQILCADEIPDRDRVYECLVRRVNQLSPACKKIISASIVPSNAPVNAPSRQRR
jgi:hypothetical protein